MPRVASNTSAWILEWLVLQPGNWKTNGAAILDQTLATGGDEVSHRATLPHMAVQPQAAFHRVDHPFAAKRKFAIRPIAGRVVTIDRRAAHSRPEAMKDQLQVIRPSSVEGAIAVAVPKYTVHFSAPSAAWVAEADQPPEVASGTEIVTPVEVRKLSCDRLLL
jgi:hypothetical protein